MPNLYSNNHQTSLGGTWQAHRTLLSPFKDVGVCVGVNQRLVGGEGTQG